MLSSKGNSLAMERMREKDELDRQERLNTKQKVGTPTRDVGLQQRLLNWMMETLDERPKGKTDYDHWIKDGTVLVKILQAVMFNSVPADCPLSVAGLTTVQERVRGLIKYLRKFGVPDEYVFDERDLVEFKNIPKVTRCFAMLAKMAGVEAFSGLSLEIPQEEEDTQRQDSTDDES